MRVLLFLATALTLSAEPAHELGAVDVWMNNGVHVRVTARIGGTAPTGYGLGFRTTDRNTVYREFMDNNRVVFGYEIEVTRLTEKDRIQVEIKPLGPEYARITRNKDVPTFPAARELPLMWLGDKATIDLLENPSTGQKVTDTIEADAAPRSAVSEPGNNENYEVLSDSEISDASECWVLHDSRKPTAQRASGNAEAFFQAAASGMENFYSKK